MLTTRRASPFTLVILAASAVGGQAVGYDLAALTNVCAGGAVDVVISPHVFGTGDGSICTATGSISLGPAVTFQDGSETLLQAPLIRVDSGVDAELGSDLALGNISIAPVPKTGQAACYDSAGTVIACGETGQDGDLQKGRAWPVPRFTIHGDGTVTDNLTALRWMANPECGNRFNFPTTGWTAALTAANAMAQGQCGLTDTSSAGDWRLPNVRELASLFHFGFAGPALPNTAGTGQWQDGDPFSGIHGILQRAPNSYWTSTSYWTRTDLVRCAALYDGNLYLCGNGATLGEYVWQVRGRTSAASPAPIPATGQTNSLHAGDDGALREGLSWPVPRFTDNLDGTVTDNATGLVWLRNAGCAGFFTTWTNALSQSNALAHGQCGLSDGSSAGDWRLPNIVELQSLLHYAYFDPALPNAAGNGQWAEGEAFSDVKSGSYWSSTTVASNPANAWCMTPEYGYPARFPKSLTSNFYVWPVRDGQTPAGVCGDGAPDPGEECDDGDICTEDTCENNVCRYTPIPGCCNTSSDCGNADPCSVGCCTSNNTCSYSGLSSCCTADSQCDDGSSCTYDTCDLDILTCEYMAIPGCCASDSDCSDSNPCTSDFCIDGECLYTPVLGCCLNDGDCWTSSCNLRCDTDKNLCVYLP